MQQCNYKTKVTTIIIYGASSKLQNFNMLVSYPLTHPKAYIKMLTMISCRYQLSMFCGIKRVQARGALNANKQFLISNTDMSISSALSDGLV